MADGMLDYGAPDGESAYTNNPVVDPGEVHLQDEGMDAEMQEWEEGYKGGEEEYEAERRRKLDELLASRRTKFYALPSSDGIEAGARRGLQSLPALKDDELIGAEEPSTRPDTPGTIGKGLDIRYNALHITGPPITQCSTSRLFAYITHYGAQPLGLEWINDQSCNVVFSDAKAARIAMEYLCPGPPPDSADLSIFGTLPDEEELERAVQVKRLHDTGEDLHSAQEHEWSDAFLQSILLPRKAHRIPGKLYNAPERDAATARRAFESSNAKAENEVEMSDDRPEIYRELEQEDRKRFLQKDPSQVALNKLRSTLWIRWTVESFDVKGSRAAAQSQWYREHGRDAGKEVVSKVLQVGGDDDRRELFADDAIGKPDRRNDGRVKRGHGRLSGRGQGGSGAAMDELDRELDAWRDRADDAAVGGDPEARRRRRRGSRSATTMAALDEEMEMDRRDRSASPVRRGPDGTAIRVRGRGRMRAPSAWDDGQQDHRGSLESRLGFGGSPYDDRRQYRSDRDRGSRGGLEGRLAPSEQGVRGDLMDRIR